MGIFSTVLNRNRPEFFVFYADRTNFIGKPTESTAAKIAQGFYGEYTICKFGSQTKFDISARHTRPVVADLAVDCVLVNLLKKRFPSRRRKRKNLVLYKRYPIKSEFRYWKHWQRNLHLRM